jgi:hypothetical protein
VLGCNISQSENFHQVWVARSSPATGTGAAATTNWHSYQVYDGGPLENTDQIFAALAVDDSGDKGVPGTVYAAFSLNHTNTSTFDIWMTHSINQGQNWSAPTIVNHGPGTHYFPWLAAGSKGRVGVIWYHSPDYTPTDAEQSPWNVLTSLTLNGRAKSPVFTQAEVDHIAHVGAICTHGIACTGTGNRDLADSISIAIDRGGALVLVWTDQGKVLNGDTLIRYGCVSGVGSALAGANTALACKGPASP